MSTCVADHPQPHNTRLNARGTLGPHAEGNDGTDEVVFAAFMGENHTGLTPLERFGFVPTQGRCQRVTACTATIASSEGEPSKRTPAGAGRRPTSSQNLSMSSAR